MHPAVAHIALQRVLLDVAVAAVQLQGLVADVEAQVGGEPLGHGAEGAFVRVAVVQLPGRQPHHLLRRHQVGGHVRQGELHALELAHRLIELAALLHVALRLGQRRRGRAQRAAGDIDAAAVQAGHGDLEALALVADAVFHRHARVLENHRPGGLAFPAHLVLVAAVADAGRVRRDREAGNAAGAGPAGARHQHQQVGVAGAGNERLGAVQHIVVAVAAGAGFQRRRVGAGARLGEAIGGQRLAAHQRPVPALAHRLGAEPGQHPGGHVVDGDERGGGGAARRHPLEDQRRVEPAQAHAALVLVAVQRAEAQLAGAADGVLGEGAVLVPLGGERRQLLIGELARGVAERQLLVGEVEVHGYFRLMVMLGPPWAPSGMSSSNQRLVTVLVSV